MLEIRNAKAEDKEEVVDYILSYRNILYPMLPRNIIPNDLLYFEDTYISNEKSAFLIATDKHKIIGTIGCIPYNNRFAMFDYSNFKTAEIVRLYVEPSFRRKGLGNKLFEHIFKIAEKFDYQILYLHTHPFLKGATEFWQKNNFFTIFFDDNPLLPTSHMQRLIHRYQD